MKVKKYKFEPYSPEWENERNAMARAIAPRIYPCKKCGAPVVSGYICEHCGDKNPSSSERD